VNRAALLIVLAVPLAAACTACSKATTVTRMQTVTVTQTQTVIRQPPQPVYVPQGGGTPEYKPSAIYISADSGDIWVIKKVVELRG
jgi:hypothetical protein